MDTNVKERSSAWAETFYRGLQDLVDSSFPKKCQKCGKIYPTTAAFLAETIPVRDMRLEDRSGLFCLEGGGFNASVGLFRNCACGTTMMADFQDRRDISQEGQARRRRFSALLDMLGGKGVSRAEARLELLRILRGETSPLLEDLLGQVTIA